MAERWRPRIELSTLEALIMSRLRRTRKLFAFLREYRNELFDDGFQAELERMYRDTGAGSEPKPPAQMAMLLLFQAYVRASDAEAVELTIMDRRWQMVLDRLNAEEPFCSQGAIEAFRARMIKFEMDRRLLEKTAEIARRTHAFDPKKLPKSLRLAVDSMPLEGAGRVEDTFNLIAHAARKVAECAAMILERTVETVCEDARAPLLLATSVKRGLDIDWTDEEQKEVALNRLVRQVESLVKWVERKLGEASQTPPLSEQIATLEQILTQDLEPDPSGSRKRVREGVAPERVVSVEDTDMRHGRKSKTKLFNGFKRHIAADLDTGVIVVCTVTPANRPEAEATAALKADLVHQGLRVSELHVDRGYIKSALVAETIAEGGEVICKPWAGRNVLDFLFSKREFDVNVRRLTIRCPAGQTQPFRPGEVVEFEAEQCDRCRLRVHCTTAAPGRGRTVAMTTDEELQDQLRRLQATTKGRERMRERVAVEHNLAHVSQRQGRRARYRGVRKNVLDLRRVAAIQNLENAQRRHALNSELANAA